MNYEVLSFEFNVIYYFSKEIVGIPLVCFQSKNQKKDYGIGGIKFKMPQYGHSKHSKNDRRHPNNVEFFYNIGGEKNWIESALSEEENNDVIVKWVYVVKKVRFLDHECGQKIYDNTKTEKTAHIECINALHTCHVNNVKLATKSENQVIHECDNVEEECQKKMDIKFGNKLDGFFHSTTCPPGGRKESRSNNSSRFSQNLPFWTVLNILLFLKLISNRDL